ncbi:MAG: flagellar motor switch protein FliG [Gemmatimonadetes bacterium]|jgi:flagellar motor switch protein FliG|nr:flagellar motor switch protein FliG [Gemmatimonadota bacterium]
MSEEKGRREEIKPVVWATEKEVDAWPPIELSRPEPSTSAEPAPEEAKAPKLELPAGIAEDSTHAFLFAHAEEAAAVLRTLVRKNIEGDGPLAGVAGAQLAATFVIGVGEEIGARVLEKLEWDEVKSIAEGVVQMEETSRHACLHALELVRKRIEEEDYLELGGEQYARGMLGKMMEPYRVDWMVESAQLPEISGFEMLARMKPEQVAPFVSHEHPQTVAMILSQLPPAQASGILACLPERMQSDVAYRVTTMEDISTAALQRVEESLTRSLRSLTLGTANAGGPKVMADMLNLTGSSVEKNVLDQMDGQDPEAAEAVRNLMFLFCDIAKLTDREIQTLLREVDQKDLTIALKAASEELKDKVLGNISEEVRKKITEDMEFLGPMRLSEVEEVQLRIVQQVRLLEEKGQITIVRGDSDDTFV